MDDFQESGTIFRESGTIFSHSGTPFDPVIAQSGTIFRDPVGMILESGMIFRSTRIFQLKTGRTEQKSGKDLAGLAAQLF